LDTFKARFPSRHATWLAFSSIVFVINVWAIINILRAVPSWILSRTIWEMIGIISYPLAFALLESAVFLIGLVILAVILPGKLLRESFAAQGSLAGLLATLGMVLGHLYGKDFGIWSVRGFSKYLLILVGIVIASWILIYFLKRLRSVIESIAERLSPLSTVYLALDLLAVIIIIVRNF
jgi:hypothetical protein